MIVTAISATTPSAFSAVMCPSGTEPQTDATSDGSVSWCQKDDTLHGPFERHYQSGSLQVKGEYSDGQATGFWTRYWENGQLRDTGAWKSGRPAGPWLFYDSSGKQTEKIVYAPEDNPAMMRMRAGIFSLKTHKPDNERDEERAPFVGADFHIYKIKDWLRFRLMTDLTYVKVGMHMRDSFGFYKYEENNVWALLVFGGLELIPPWFSRVSLTFKFGRAFSYNDSAEGSVDKFEDSPANAMEIRYYFHKKYFGHLDSLYLSGGDVGNKDEDSNGFNIIGAAFTF